MESPELSLPFAPPAVKELLRRELLRQAGSKHWAAASPYQQLVSRGPSGASLPLPDARAQQQPGRRSAAGNDEEEGAVG